MRELRNKKIRVLIFTLFFSIVALLICFFSFLVLDIRTDRLAEKKREDSFEGRLKESREETYFILTKENQNPKITEVKINPIDAKEGETQKITVYVKDAKDSPITGRNRVDVKVFVDEGGYNIPLEMKKINGNKDFTLITWEGVWEWQGTTEQKYQIEINAQNMQKNHLITLTIK